MKSFTPHFSTIAGSVVARIIAQDPQKLYELVRNAYAEFGARRAVNSHSAFLTFKEIDSSSPDRIIALPACIGTPEHVAGVKWVASFPRNIELNIPRASAVGVERHANRISLRVHGGIRHQCGTNCGLCGDVTEVAEEQLATLDARLKDVYCRVLMLDSIASSDNILDVGGHSIPIMRIVGILRQELEIEVSVMDIFRAPTIAQLSRTIWGRRPPPGSSGNPVVRPAALGAVEGEVAFERLRRHDKERAFDFARPSLMRFTLIAQSDSRHRFIWTYHHCLLDGWSEALVWDEVLSAYESLSRDAAPTLPQARPFSDYIRWLNQQDSQASLDYWREYLSGIAAASTLSMEQHGLKPDRRPAEVGCEFSHEHTIRLRQAASSHRPQPHQWSESRFDGAFGRGGTRSRALTARCELRPGPAWQAGRRPAR